MRFVLFLFFFLFTTGIAQAKEVNYCSGEVLSYELLWEKIAAGTATLEVLPEMTFKGKPALHFTMQARTNSFVDIFYKVRNSIHSYVAPDMSHSLYFIKKQREGSYKRTVTLTFDWENGRVQYVSKEKGPKKPLLLLPGTFDPLAVFYAFRQMDISLNSTITVPVTDGRKTVIGSATVEKYEKVTVPAGSFDTFLVVPDLQHLGGVFKKSPEANMYIWVTADERKIPVKISSKVAVGNFHVRLTGIKAPKGCYKADKKN